MNRRHKMPYYVGTLLLLILVLGWVGHFAANRLANLTEDLYEHPLTVSTAVLRINANMLVMRLAMKDLVLSNSPEVADQYHRILDQTEEKILADFSLVEERFLGDIETAHAARRAFLAWKPIREDIIRLMLEGKRAEAALVTQTADARQEAEIETKINELRDFARNKSREFLATAKETRSRTLWLVWFSVGGSLILAGIVMHKAVRLESKLQEFNEQLEFKVRQRTAELATANENLTAQNEEITAQSEELSAQNEEITAMNDELTAQNEEINAMNVEINGLNRNLEAMNEKLEQRVAERTSELTDAHVELAAQYEELRDTGDHLRKLIQYANAPIIVWNPDFVITSFNAAFERLTGYVSGEVVGKPLSMLFPEGSLPESVKLIEQSRSGLQWESVEIPICRKNGDVRVALWSSANIYAADGVTLSAVIAQGQDITERVRREQENLRDAQLAARVQNALLSVPESSDYLATDTIFQPFGYVGGDLYFLDWRYDGSLLRGFLVDATGHGLGTALHTASLHVLLREVNERDLPLADAMRWLNRRAGQYFDEGTFAGALGFEIDLQTRQLRWTCAGIPQIWVDTKALHGVVKRPGMLLGLLEGETFDMHTLPIDVGDSFYFMTDGLSDLLGRLDLPLDRYPEMVGVLRELSKSSERRDDTTAICIHVCALPQSLSRQDGWPRILRFNGYGDYNRLRNEVADILAEVTGESHSIHEVAVNEALANAMECRDGVPRQHTARLCFNKVGNRLIVRVKTSRIGFAGNAILRRLRSHPGEMFAFGEDAAMGRGIPMMLSMSHRMMYNSEGTEVLLAWKL